MRELKLREPQCMETVGCYINFHEFNCNVSVKSKTAINLEIRNKKY